MEELTLDRGAAVRWKCQDEISNSLHVFHSGDMAVYIPVFKLDAYCHTVTHTCGCHLFNPLMLN